MYLGRLVSIRLCRLTSCFFFFFNDTATTEIYTLSLHDALPICRLQGRDVRLDRRERRLRGERRDRQDPLVVQVRDLTDRKSTRLNSSHSQISYAVFCLKKKNTSSTTISTMTSIST